ncbi:Serine phosphatase RsbU, regulator of sigma subunit [Pseudomonas chlororaphis]
MACMILTCKVRAGLGDCFGHALITGELVSLLNVLRSQSEQVTFGVRLMIDASGLS